MGDASHLQAAGNPLVALDGTNKLVVSVRRQLGDGVPMLALMLSSVLRHRAGCFFRPRLRGRARGGTPGSDLGA
jgi:hypothetical protein